MDAQQAPVIWRCLDGRAGHENQVLGLAEAIQRRLSVSVCDVSVTDELRGLQLLWRPLPDSLRRLPRPDLLIGAGHRTHLPMLLLQRRCGGRTVVIMKPSLPLSLFDLCLIPVHDHVRAAADHVLRIEGALNRLVRSQQQQADRGLLLIGGPSRHVRWSTAAVLQQVSLVVQRTPQIAWTLTTSERTPRDFLERWRQLQIPTRVVEYAAGRRDWLPGELALCGTAWVTADSVSMVYEALTSGAAVGVLDATEVLSDRLRGSLQRLVAQGLVTRWTDWNPGAPLERSALPLREADRCAAAVIRHCLPRQAVRRAELADAVWSHSYHPLAAGLSLPYPRR